MSESSAGSTASNIFWDIFRYTIIAVLAGFLIYFYVFYKPTNYVSREHEGKTMGTDYIVKVAHFPENADWKKVADEIQKRLDALDQMMSTYRQDSEVSRFNAYTSTEDWFSVSKDTAQIVQTALEISQLSEGAFDVTVTPLVRHWGFGAGSAWHSGSFEELRSEAFLLKEQTGYEKLSVCLDPPALKKAIPELAIDLSAIGKGFAVDCIAELLDSYKISDYLIEVGLEVRCKGKRTTDIDWIIGVEKPLSGQNAGAQQKFPLVNQSMATSGNYRQTALMGGQRVSHIIDPRTGLPAQIGYGGYELVSAAVISPNCAQADAWATAMFVLGERKGLELAHRHKIAVLFLLRSGDDIREVPSNDWEKK